MRTTPRLHPHIIAVLLTVLTLAACTDSGSSAANAAVRIASPAVAGASAETTEGLTITGSNGTLLITEIKLVVDKLELKRAGVGNCDDDIPGEPSGCEEFETTLFAADVPLGSGSVTVANDRIPAGTYGEVEFEVKDLVVNPDDPREVARAAQVAALLAELRQTLADWPDAASMTIAGEFTPTGGTPQPFRVYFRAEIEVARALVPSLVIDEGSSGLTIELRPDIWFKNSNGTVRDLSQLNYATTNTLVEFEVEFEEGIEVEVDG